MGKPFEKTTRMINEFAKPALEFLRALDDEDMKLQAMRVEGTGRTSGGSHRGSIQSGKNRSPF